MSEDRTGGPAFPQKEPLTNGHPGMTLRDYFAGQALQGVLSSLAPGEWMNYGDASEHAYHFADAMIQERNK